MTDNIELRQKYIRLIEAISRAIPPADPDDGPIKRGLQGPPVTPGKIDQLALSAAVTGEMMSAIRLRVVADKAGNKAAMSRAQDRIDAIARGWCGNDPIIIVIPPRPWPDPDPQPDWMMDSIRRRDDLASGLMAEIAGMHPGALVDAVAEIATQVLQN